MCLCLLGRDSIATGTARRSCRGRSLRLPLQLLARLCAMRRVQGLEQRARVDHCSGHCDFGTTVAVAESAPRRQPQRPRRQQPWSLQPAGAHSPTPSAALSDTLILGTLLWAAL